MSNLVSCENVSLQYPCAQVFDALSLGFDEGARIGIVGNNGGGKSSLLNLIAGKQSPDSGRIVLRSSIQIAYLGQRDSLDDEATVLQSVVGECAVHEWAADKRVRQIMNALLQNISSEAKIKTLSGGQRRRVDLARVLISEADVLLLDEPTNHLDIEGIYWLAQHLKTRWKKGRGAFLLVTHDRWFLDEVCEQMWEVHDGIITPFEGGYSAYVLQRIERDRQSRVLAAKRRNVLRRELAWLSRGAPARSTKPRFRVDRAKDLIADEPPLRKKVELKRSSVSRLGKKVIEIKNASVVFDKKTIIKPLDFSIGPSSRIGILGSNGAGKSTFLSLCMGKLQPNTGRVEIGQTVKFAMLDQQLDLLEKHKGIRVRNLCEQYKTRYELADGKSYTPLQLLEELGFEKDQVNEFVEKLSGGQKRRLQLMLILLDSPNVLILDEPGNDLDTDMLAQLETLLDSWPTTLILVSHDRYLVERVTDMQYALIDGNLIHVPRGVEQYLELLEQAKHDVQSKHGAQGNQDKQSKYGEHHSQLGARAENGAEKHVQTAAQVGAQSSVKSGVQAGCSPINEHKQTLSNKEQYVLKKERSSLERKMTKAQDKLKAAQDKLLACDPTDYEELGSCQAEIDETKKQLSELEDKWLELEERLEA